MSGTFFICLENLAEYVPICTKVILSLSDCANNIQFNSDCANNIERKRARRNYAAGPTPFNSNCANALEREYCLAFVPMLGTLGRDKGPRNASQIRGV